SGFQFDMVNGGLGFQPVQPENGEFNCFWSLDSGWGQFQMTPQHSSLEVLYGSLTLRSLQLPFLADATVSAITLDGEPVAFQKQDGAISLQAKTEVQAGQTLQVLY
ncbi:MAG: hypothetical protein OXI52_08025, partial [Caldilineaceae bacterium]|nr:hypothetical protein [Caldilineaceae bacterium]